MQTEAQQQVIQLRIQSTEGQPTALSTIKLIQLPDSLVVVQKAVGSQDTLFAQTRYRYQLIVTHQGYRIYDTVFTVYSDLNRIDIRLQRIESDLDRVVVVSKKPLIREEDDKTIVDATALAQSSTNAFEVVEKTPGAIIDQDGNVFIASTTPATIFINGREMKLSASDLTSLLKSLPANSVSKIELQRNPSAKFDAASSGGILNIVLKKGVKLGSSGSANASYFQGVYATKTAGLSFNRSVNKLNSYASYQFTDRTNYEELNSDRIFFSDSSLFRQYSFTRYPTTTHYAALGSDYAFNNRWSLSTDFRLTHTINNNEATNDIDVRNLKSGVLLGVNNSEITNDNRSVYFSNSWNLKYKIDSAGSEWTTNAEWNHFDYRNDQSYYNTLLLPLNRYRTGSGILHNEKNNFNLQSDLVLKFKKGITLETGIKSNFSISQSQSDYIVDTGNGIFITDRYQTNTYQYRESITAAYLQCAKTFFGFTIKPGIRWERTDIYGKQIVPSDTTFSIQRNDFFPYVFLKRKLFNMFKQPLMASLIFRKSIRRPYYESLNPFPRYVDQYLFDAGNPALKPQFTTNYEFNVTFNDIPVVAVGLNRTRDIFTNVIYQDDQTKIAYRTFDNLGKNKEVYVRLITGIPPGGKYFFYLGGLYNYNSFDGFYQQQPFRFTRSSYTFFTFHEYKFTRTFTANLQGFLRTRGLQNFYELNTFGGLFVSVNKSLLKKKANIILSLSDVFRTNQVNFIFNQNNQFISGSRINDTRRIGIAIRYNFGVKAKEEKKPVFDQPAESKESGDK
jgi:hypothetical protein